MYSVGVICRYFDVDAIIARFPNEDATQRIRSGFLISSPCKSDDKIGMVRRKVLEIFGYFCASGNPHLKIMSLSSLGQLTAECPDFLLDETVKRIFIEALKDRRVQILTQALSNLNLFLISAEEKAVKTNEKFREQREGDLKGNSFMSNSKYEFDFQKWNWVILVSAHPLCSTIGNT
jgi:hypothetical protein